MTASLKQFIRVHSKFGVTRGKPIGVLVVVKTVGPDGTPVLNFGWSLCDRRDEFNKEIGTRLAMTRAAGDLVVSELPHAVRKALPAFEARAVRCFID